MWTCKTCRVKKSSQYVSPPTKPSSYLTKTWFFISRRDAVNCPTPFWIMHVFVWVISRVKCTPKNATNRWESQRRNSTQLRWYFSTIVSTCQGEVHQKNERVLVVICQMFCFTHNFHLHVFTLKWNKTFSMFIWKIKWNLVSYGEVHVRVYWEERCGHFSDVLFHT